MEQIKLVEAFADVEQDPAAETADQEIRTLKDLELVLVGGGDGTPCW
jgi:hypothetical protein